MLVHAKGPNEILHVNGYRIYGRDLGREPVDLPWKLYQEWRSLLEDAVYREGHLKKVFNKDFPMVAFRYCDIKCLPAKTLDKLGKIIPRNYDCRWNKSHKALAIKVYIKDCSPNGIETDQTNRQN